MRKEASSHDRHYQDASPARWTPLASSHSSFGTTLPPITSLTRTSTSGRSLLASPPLSVSAAAAAPLSSPSLAGSYSSCSSPHNEPPSPHEGQPLLASRRFSNISLRSSAHRTASSAMSQADYHTSAEAHSYSHHQTASPRHPRSIEDGSHLWGDGMKGIWNSLTGAAYGKPRSYHSTKGEHLEPARPSQVEAATSIWDVPRETVAMTMGFHTNYEDQSFQSQQGWQQQQQQQQHQQQHQQQQHQQPSFSSYPGAEQQPSHLSYSSSYSNMAAPSGLAGATHTPETTRSRGSSDAGAASDRLYARRPNYQHGRPADTPVDPAHNAQWWPTDSHAALDEASATAHYGNRRLQPPPLPETRSTSRPTWPNTSGGVDMSGYEFPQSTLGKRPHDDEALGASTQGSSAGDTSEFAARRYTLGANMSFSRPSAPISGLMNNHRPPHSDPRRPSLPSDPYGAQQSTSAAVQRAGYTSSSQWSPWGHAAAQPGVAGSMTPSGSSPILPAWRDNGAVRYGIESSYTSPSGMAGGAKRQQRDRSSSTASAAQQANVLANTPFHITADIVLRAPAGSKMEDVYYDQHCEIRTGMSDPPESDFEVENEEDRPRRQTDKLRFPGDLYTPRWVRGSGNAREAWCDRCESGNWLQLKNSQYWYDQVHKHGISSVSGLRFTAPTHLKVYADAAGTVEGKCHQCKEWVLICTAKRRRNFAAFYKHAHACHSYRKASAVGNGPYVEHNPGGHKAKKGTSESG